MIKVITTESLTCRRCGYCKSYEAAALAPDHCPACGHDASGKFVWSTDVAKLHGSTQWKS